MNRIFAGFFAAAGVVAAVAGLSSRSAAHHAFAAEFDINQPVEVRGKVTRARFVNPHGWIFLDVTSANGSTTNWGFEFGTPGSLKNKGITRDDVQAGTQVRIEGYRSKNTGPYGYAQTLVLPDGRRIQVGGAPDAPTLRRNR